ncbi:hypothetical protein [Nonomuraea candida]|uniref:hypothetical protein n=1 Tax=Nonomuraea candida TaxID=359159 RepID=UPI0005BD9884|nr:hypothetical protein [Nonomuraea candida]
MLVPLHSQLARGGGALDAGLLLAPMGIRAAITMPLAGRLTDSRGPRGVGAAGVLLAVAAIAAYVLLGEGPARLSEAASGAAPGAAPGAVSEAASGAASGAASVPLFGVMFVLGLGHGLVATSVGAAAYRTLERAALPAATTLSTIAVRLAAPFGVAVPAVLLQAFTAAGVARPFTYAFWAVLGPAAVSLAPIALIGSKTWRRSSSAPV